MKRRHDVMEYEGTVRAYTAPYSKNSGLIISTEIGDINVPIKDSMDYPINQKVFIKVDLEMV